MADFNPKTFAASPVDTKKLPATSSIPINQTDDEQSPIVSNIEDISEAAPGFNPKEFAASQPETSLPLEDSSKETPEPGILDRVFSTEPTALTAAVQGVGQGVTFEFQDELFKAAGDTESVERIKKTEKEFPLVFGLSRLAGAIISPNPFAKLGAIKKIETLAKAGGSSAKAAKFISNTLNITGLSALFGAGAGKEDEKLESALQAGAIGLVAGPTIGLVIKGLSSKTDVATPIISRLRAAHGSKAAQKAADIMAKESVKNIINHSAKVAAGGTSAGAIAELLGEDFSDGFMLGGGIVTGKRLLDPVLGAAGRAITSSFGSQAITALAKAKNNVTKYGLEMQKRAAAFKSRFSANRAKVKDMKQGLDKSLAESEIAKSELIHNQGILTQADDINTQISLIQDDTINHTDNLMATRLKPRQDQIIAGIADETVDVTKEINKARFLLNNKTFIGEQPNRARAIIDNFTAATERPSNPLLTGSTRPPNILPVGKLVELKRELGEVLYDRNFIANAPKGVAKTLRNFEREVNNKLNAKDPSGEMAKINEAFTNMLNLRVHALTKMSGASFESMATNAAKGAKTGKAQALSSKNIKSLREIDDFFQLQKKLPDGSRRGFSKEFLVDPKYKPLLDQTSRAIDNIIRPRVEMKTALNIVEAQTPVLIRRINFLDGAILKASENLPKEKKALLEAITERKIIKKVDAITGDNLKLTRRELSRDVPTGPLDAILGTVSPVRARRFDETGRAFRRDPATLGRARELKRTGQTPVGAALGQASAQGENILGGQGVNK